MEFKEIIDNYIKWIKDNTTIKSIKDGKICEIITPFLDRHNDHLNIYVIKNENGFIITDDGYTLKDLKMSGLEINTPKRVEIFKMAISGFGVKLGVKDNLYIEANTNNIGQKKHYLLQAIIAVNDMYTLSQENIYSLFKEDVEMFFKANEIYHSRDIKITGKTGFDHNIDFLVPSSKKEPERLIKAIGNPRKDPVMAAIFAFKDIEEIRSEKTKNYVIYNDLDQKVTSDILSAMQSYNIFSIPWTKKEICKEEFALR
jgi:guanylate kinase